VSTWWRDRDPDLGRDRETKALGRRDWNWFATYDDSAKAPADGEAGRPPWRGHPVSIHDRYDRTLGIPSRRITMWPDGENHADRPRTRPMERVEAVLDDLAGIPGPPLPTQIAPTVLAAALTDLAPVVGGRPTPAQENAIEETARRHRVDATELGRLARAVAGMIAKTTHRASPDGPGVAVLGALQGADLHAAAQLYLARATLAWAAAHSDPDLPRLWILANGLIHGVPAHTMLTAPARSHGPIARLIPEHRDLIAWHGLTDALQHLDATARAARDGRQWLTTATDTAENRILGIGVLHLTHPRVAYELASHGPNAAGLDTVQGYADGLPQPRDAADLSDLALKAACDRAGWLLGTPDERTGRELVERHLQEIPTDQVKDSLANGHTTGLAAAVAEQAPTDAHLDRATWRRTPPAPEAIQARQLLDAASREALRRFAGIDLQPHANRATAYAARFPDRLSRGLLHVTADQLVAMPGAPGRFPLPPRAPDAQPGPAL
jgi:hypothetical protein